MFTGLVEGRGRIHDVRPECAGIRLEVMAPSAMIESVRPGDSIRPSDSIRPGDSIAVNGCCLTVVSNENGKWSFQAGNETLSKTTLGALRPGDPVNLERSLPVDGRIGGHFVQGHIDGTGRVDCIEKNGDWVTIWFRVPSSLSRLLVPKGSVAVDGVSLTVVDVEPERFSVALIPHTLEVTTLGVRREGDAVNIETDILGKYVQKLLHA